MAPRRAMQERAADRPVPWARAIASPRDLWLTIVFVIAVGASAVFLGIYHTEFNEAFFFALRWLALPALAAGLWLGAGVERALSGRAWSVRGLALGVLAAGLFILLSSGYVSAINTAGVRGRDVAVEGPVVGRCRTGTHGGGYVLTVRDGRLHRDVRIRVDRETYRSRKIGTTHAAVMQKGRLGILFQNRVAGDPAP